MVDSELVQRPGPGNACVSEMVPETATLLEGRTREAAEVHGPPDNNPRGSRTARVSTMAVINAASVLEKTDEQMLPSVYKYVSCSMDASPEQLGYVTFSRALCQALFSALGGYLGHEYNRVHVVAAGCLIWGTMTMLFTFTNSVQVGAFIWAWNGVGLAFVIPNTQSLVADYFRASDRGKAFGILSTTGAIGGMLGAAFATNAAGYTFMLDIDGWRFAFRIVAMTAFVVAAATLAFAYDPHYQPGVKQKPFASHPGSFAASLRSVREVASIPTFQVIIAQGILGTMPWNALVFLTLYLQLIGFSNYHASLVLSAFLGGCALGGSLGGWVGDWAATRSPDHGRIAACQVSVFAGVPFTVLLLKGLPMNGSDASVTIYVAVVFVFGLVHTWAAPACNNPIFAEIVPLRMRNLAYAFDRSFEGAIAALGAPLVGVVAQRVFHFPKNEAAYTCAAGKPIDNTGTLVGNVDKAKALSSAMLWCMVIPWTLCFLIYSFLHKTYPRDRRRVAVDGRSLVEEDTHSINLELPEDQ